MPTSPVVGIAHETALTELLEHAYCSGVRHPVLFAPDEKSGWGVVLRDTFLRWCRQHQLTGIHRTTAFKERRFREDEGDLMAAMLTGADPVDLIVVPGEHAALATIEVIRDMGLRVGRHVLLAAFGIERGQLPGRIPSGIQQGGDQAIAADSTLGPAGELVGPGPGPRPADPGPDRCSPESGRAMTRHGTAWSPAGRGWRAPATADRRRWR
ncbi:substrate-binding domain-containing protein [Streptomyces malaysiensis]|uniref:substrate-binding domain-containing protein n=1 Tax=Streptomyces malaysiensis TaxID=92644 RepID=UPI0036C87F71